MFFTHNRTTEQERQRYSACSKRNITMIVSTALINYNYPMFPILWNNIKYSSPKEDAKECAIILSTYMVLIKRQ